MKNATFRNKPLEYNKEQVERAETTNYTTETSPYTPVSSSTSRCVVAHHTDSPLLVLSWSLTNNTISTQYIVPQAAPHKGGFLLVQLDEFPCKVRRMKITKTERMLVWMAQLVYPVLFSGRTVFIDKHHSLSQRTQESRCRFANTFER